MFLLKIVTILVLAGSITYLLVILLTKHSDYSDYINALDKKEFSLKSFFPIGFYILDRLSYSYNTSYDRKMLSYLSEIYGQEYSAFYVRVMYANKIVLIALFILIELITGLITGYDLTYIVYVLLLLVLLLFSQDQKLGSKVKKRRLEIQLEFPNFINKLTLLLNAGLTMSKAWEKISSDRKPNNYNNSFYSEVDKTVADIKAGRNEAEAYSQFAKRAKTPEISRLMSTILQNTKRGGNDLVLSMRLQSNECWEMRKNAIRRLGEEASTKLLLPMMIMFFAIIIIVVTPAILSMRGISSEF